MITLQTAVYNNIYKKVYYDINKKKITGFITKLTI